MGVSLTKMLILGWVNTNINVSTWEMLGLCPSYEPLKMAFRWIPGVIRLWWISSGWDLTSQWPGVDAAEGYALGRGELPMALRRDLVWNQGNRLYRPSLSDVRENDGSPCQGFPLTKGSCRDTAQRNGYWNSSVQRWYLDGAGNLQLIWGHCWYFTSCTWSIFLLSRQFSPEGKGFGPDAWGSKTPKDRVWFQNHTRIERERWWDFLSSNKLSFVKDLELLTSGKPIEIWISADEHDGHFTRRSPKLRRSAPSWRWQVGGPSCWLQHRMRGCQGILGRWLIYNNNKYIYIHNRS
jgi:hypothetical protein